MTLLDKRKFWFNAITSQYCPEYKAVLDYATQQADQSAYEKPSAWDRLQEDAWVRLFVSSGVWALADQIFNLSANGGPDFSLINMKNPGTKNATRSATPPKWIKGQGWYGDGAASYLRTNFTPLTDGVNFSQDNSGVYIAVIDNLPGSSSFVDFGATDAAAAKGTLASIKNTGNNIVAKTNQDTNTIISNPSGAIGRYALSRSGSSIFKVFRNGVQLGSTSNVASTGLTSKEMFIGAYNNNGAAASFSQRLFGFWIVSSNLDAVIAALDSYVSTYLGNSLVVTSPSFPDKTSLSNYLASTSLLASSADYSIPAQEVLNSGGTSVDCFGGALASNDCIYCAPGSLTVALKINTLTKTASTIGGFGAGGSKYGGAVFANGSVYFIPANSTVVAKINTSTDAVSWFDQTGVKGTESGALGATAQKWYGGYIGQDGKIYCIPYNATSVMIIDPTTDGITFLDTSGIVAGPGGNLGGTGQWDTGVCYGRYIYGTPSNGTTILKIDTSGQTCAKIGTFPAGTAKWAYAILAPNGYVYFMPYFDQRIVKYDPTNDTFVYIAATIGATDGNIKVGGASLMANGKILIATDTATYTNNYVLDTADDSLTAFLRNNLNSLNGMVLARDGSLYGIPHGVHADFVRYSFTRRTITLPDNFTDSNFIKGY